MSTLHDRTPHQLLELASALGLPAYRGRQLARGLYGRGALLEELTDLPAGLRDQLRRDFGTTELEAVETHEGEDGTSKYLLQLADGKRIEAVAIPRGEGQFTYCLSTQVGCRMACVFCATARMGLVRHLTAGEIVAQVLFLKRRHPGRTHPRLVFMGMGEPLDNFDALATALEILTDAEGVGLGARRITVSTSGLVEGIERLSTLRKPYGLAVSVTTADADKRRRLMPVAATTPMEVLLAAAADYGRQTHRKVTLECALIAGENDTEEDAHKLLDMARRGPFKVNLIPLNPIDGYAGGRPDHDRVNRFVDLLWSHGVVATVRDSQGRDVAAACGQLLHKKRRPPSST